LQALQKDYAEVAIEVEQQAQLHLVGPDGTGLLTLCTVLVFTMDSAVLGLAPLGMVLVFRQDRALEDVIGSHACSLQALAGVRPMAFLLRVHSSYRCHNKLCRNAEGNQYRGVTISLPTGPTPSTTVVIRGLGASVAAVQASLIAQVAELSELQQTIRFPLLKQHHSHVVGYGARFYHGFCRVRVSPIGYGARFTTEFCARECYWITFLLASSQH
jgi:hypothetical protein